MQAVREGEALNLDALSRYLDAEVEVEQFPGGHSNLTYLLRADGREYVLRRPPLGPVPLKAHDMVREARVLQAVHPHFPPAPRVYRICEDPSVIGAPFFLMERKRGIVLRDRVPPELADSPHRISAAFVDCLVQLHSIDIQRHGLTVLGKPEGFVERQVKGWSERWRQAQTEDSREMDRVIAWLSATIPPSGRPTLVHNDFKLDNVMIDPNAPDRIAAVLDWEMATVGDPLCDVGLTLCYWTSHLVPGAGTQSITSGPGWFVRDEIVERYAAQTGHDVSALPWHEVLGVFKLAVILQQIYFRYRRGQTADERFRNFDERVRGLAKLAHEMVEKLN